MAAAAAAVSWMAAEWIVRGVPTTLGFASGAVAGLVAVTPAAGFVSPISAVLIGLAAGPLCYGAVLAKGAFQYDDSLDVVGIHAVGGAWGAIATGLFASAAIGGVDGALNGNPGQLFVQVVAVAATAMYSFIATALILLFVQYFITDVRAFEKEEHMGMDLAMHGESGYNLD
jgi:Amt family ammonium transporter